jgi:hypothetical protein
MRTNLLISLILINLVTRNLFADEALSLIKGTAAPYSGVLLPLDQATDLRNSVLERDSYKKLNDSLNQSIDIYKTNEQYDQQKINLLVKQNDDLTKATQSERSLTDLEKMLYFGAGVVVLGFSLYGAKQLSK